MASCIFPNCFCESNLGHAYCSETCFKKFKNLESKKCPMYNCDKQVTKGHCFCGKEHAMAFRKNLVEEHNRMKNKQCNKCMRKIKTDEYVKHCGSKCAKEDKICCLPGCTKPKSQIHWSEWNNSFHGRGFSHYCCDQHAIDHVRSLDDGSGNLGDFEFLYRESASTIAISQMCDY